MIKDVMNVAFLGLGGNLGNRLENLRSTRAEIDKRCGRVIRASRIYETQAWGSPSLNSYLNQVIQIETLLSPEQLLSTLLDIEHALGRTRLEPNADRTSDVDILLYNEEIMDKPHLHIPHPRMHLRKFVLIPFCEIAPNAIHPVLRKSMSVLLEDCKDSLEVRKLEEA
jgi:2-amino-4-hydroxy-6-hydroxymethyldihydropteridine diphosphokinase